MGTWRRAVMAQGERKAMHMHESPQWPHMPLVPPYSFEALRRSDQCPVSEKSLNLKDQCVALALQLVALHLGNEQLFA